MGQALHCHQRASDQQSLLLDSKNNYNSTNNSDERHGNKGYFTRKECITRCIPCIIDSLSFVTCQYIRPVNDYDRAKKNCPARCSCCCSTPFMIVLIAIFALFAIGISIIPTSAFLAGWIECPYDKYNICFTVYKQHGTPIVVLKDTNHTTTEPSLINNENIIEVQEFLDLSKIAILFSTTASGVSQVFFFWALCCLFIKHYDWPHDNCTNSNSWKKLKSFFGCVRDNDNESTKPLDPFDDDVENEFFEPSSIVVVYQHKKKKISTSGQMESYFMEQDERTNTPLQGERLCHYIICFAIALLLIITISLFFVVQYAKASKGALTKTSLKLERAAVVFHAYSLFRSLVSCFIFSKLMYGIQRKCEELEMFVLYVDDNYKKLLDENNEVYKYVQIQFDNVLKKLEEKKKPEEKSQQDNTPTPNRQGSDNAEIVDSYNYIIDKISIERAKTLTDGKALALKYLDERDKHFVKKAVATLSWLQLWFLLHWLLHILSTFMIMTVLIDAVTLHVKARVPHLEQGVDFHPGEIGFLFMYSLLQCFFLFYPCLRAASVTRTRQRVIRNISENIHSFNNIPPGVLNEFIDSMKRRKFSFQLRILCAQMPFNMNIAYLSIAFGFVGIILSLITSVTS